MSDQAWYPDSGASTHITSNPRVISDCNLYSGVGTVVVGNGHRVSISHISNSVLSNGSDEFLFKDLLYVPDINKNLLSVSRFTQDNNVYFEFYPTCCYVKDLATHRMIFQGVESNGLYHFFPATSNFLLNSTTTTNADLGRKFDLFSRWHQRLGHPSCDVVRQVLNSCNISIPKNKLFTLCNACGLSKGHKLPFAASSCMYSSPLELVVTDLWGLTSCFSSGF